MTLKTSRPGRALALGLGAALACSLVLGSTLAAQADTPAPSNTATIQQLVQRYGGGGLKHGPVRNIKPNVKGLVSKKQAANFRTLSAGALPDSYSLQKYDMPVGNQQQVNSCVGWAIGYSMLGWYSMYQGQYKSYAPMYIYSQDHYGKDQGSTVADAYSILTKQGIVTQSQYPQGNYNWTSTPTAAEKQAAAANTVTAPHWLYDVYASGNKPGSEARTAIETAITKKHPVALSIDIYDPFYSLSPHNSVLRGSQIPGTTNYGGHEVLIVGYNSTGVIIQNQWGSDWGNNGYATLDWNFVENYSSDASWIAGFTKNLPGQVPAAIDNATVNGAYNSDAATVNLQMSWRGTAAYDDSVRHPVTSYAATLTGSDGSVQTYTSKPALPGYSQNVYFQNEPADVNYSLSVAPVNDVGTGLATTYAFAADSSADVTLPRATDEASPDMPAALPLPAIAPSGPSNVKLTNWYTGHSAKVTKDVMTWSAPKDLGRSSLSGYRIQVVGKSGSHTKYSHTFTFSKSTKSASFSFTGKYHLVHGLKYTFTISAENTAGYWSTGQVWQTRTI